VVAPVDARYRTLPQREARANIGMGFQTVPAAIATLANRGQFGLLGLQSFMGLESEFGALQAAMDEGEDQEAPVRAYLEWGRWDLRSPHEGWDLRESGREMRTLMQARHCEVVGGEVWDGADVGSWRNRTHLLLAALFPAGDDTTLVAAELDEWLVFGP
jgi:hypothetical protein